MLVQITSHQFDGNPQQVYLCTFEWQQSQRYSVDDTINVQFIELELGNPNTLAAYRNFSNSLEMSSMALAAEIYHLAIH